MSKIGRNETCPCNSGKKYKKCCQSKDAIASRERQINQQTSQNDFASETDPYENLDSDSNSVVDLANNGFLDKAEKAARKLLIDYPEVIDGLERLAMVYEKKGDRANAIEMYQKALDFTLTEQDFENFDEEGREYYRETIEKLKNELKG